MRGEEGRCEESRFFFSSFLPRRGAPGVMRRCSRGVHGRLRPILELGFAMAVHGEDHSGLVGEGVEERE